MTELSSLFWPPGAALVLLTLLVSRPAAAFPQPPPHTIVGGSATTGDPAVVALVSDGRVFCTGALLSPRVVLTAGHCIASRPTSVLFGTDVDHGVQVPVATWLAHPDFIYATLDNDLGILVLGDPVVEAPLAFADESPVAGTLVRVVGFGSTGNPDDPTLKREGAARVSSTDGFKLFLDPEPAMACNGDSGGPVMIGPGAGPSIVGVISSGDDDCTENNAVSTSAYRGFVREMLSRSEATSSLGEWCWSDANCPRGECAKVNAGDKVGVCVERCDDDADCPSQFGCVPLENGDRRCLPSEPLPGADGAPCADIRDCNRHVCASAEVGEPGRCRALCNTASSKARCIEGGGECVKETGADRVICVPVPPLPASSSGCSAARTGASRWTWLVLLALTRLGLALRRR